MTDSSHKLRYVLVLIAAPFAPGVSTYAQSSPRDSSDVDNSALTEVVVTAQKREEKLKDVPISISVLGGQDLEQGTFQGVTAALNTVPGVAATTAVQGATTLIEIRGVGAGGPQYSGSSTVAYYLDSVPFGFVKQAILPDPDVYDLQRVEVLRGPQGTLYGANAENGVVRVLTNDANPDAFELKARTLVSTTDGGGGNYGGDVAINAPIVDGKLAVRGVLDYQDSSGWINGPLGDHLNDAELRNYRLKINAQPTDPLSIGLSVWSTRDNYGAPNNSTQDRKITATIQEPISSDFDTYALKVGYEFPDFSLSSATSYIDYTNSYPLDAGPYELGLPFGIPIVTDFHSRVASEELLLNSADKAAWRWTGGLFYRDAKDRLFQTIPGISPAPDDFTNGSKSYSAFGQLGHDFLNDAFEWTAGLRFFHDDVLSRENVQSEGLTNVPLIRDTVAFNSTTPRAVLTWHPNPDLTLYSSYSVGFRSGFPQNPPVLEVAPQFPAAKPETLRNYEIGMKADLIPNRLSIDASLYYIQWRNVQQALTVLSGTSSVPVDVIVNAQSASGPGLDFSLTARPVDGLDLGATFGWNDLTMDAAVSSLGTSGLPVVLFAKGDRLNYSPEFTGGLRGDYSHSLGNGFAGRFSVSGNYSSKMTDSFVFGQTRVLNEGQGLLNVHTDFTIVFPTHWTTTLFVDNLTNNYGAIPAFGYPVAEITPRPRPRTVGLHMDYAY
jgi:iron complex outermembrane recepter protein